MREQKTHPKDEDGLNSRALNDLFFLIFIKMFILKFQARNAEKLLQANLQSPTRIKISRNQMCMRLFFHRFINRDLI